MAAGSCRPVRCIWSMLHWDSWLTLVILLKDFCWNYSELFQSNLPFSFNILWLSDHANLFKEKKNGEQHASFECVTSAHSDTQGSIIHACFRVWNFISVYISNFPPAPQGVLCRNLTWRTIKCVYFFFFFFEDHKLCVMSGFAIGQRFTQSDIVWIMEGPYFVITLCLLRLMDWPKRELGRSWASI